MPDKRDISYELLTELDAVTDIAPQWNSLLARSACNLAFGSAQWFIGSCRLNQSARPNVLVARRDGALVGVLPLVLEGTITKFPDNDGDYNDLVTAPDDTSTMTGLLNQALAAAPRYLVLSRLRDDSNCLRAAQILYPNGDLDKLYLKDTTCPHIRLPSTYDEYLLTRSKSFRTSLQQVRRYAERNNVRVTELQPDSFPAGRLPDIFLSLHLDRFAEDSALASPIAAAFVREVFPSLFLEHRLRAFALYETERIIAISLCMVGANSLGVWNGGFAADAGRWSPGKLLISAGIEQAYALNLNEYDFLRGSETYKSRWANEERTIGWLVLTNRH